MTNPDQSTPTLGDLALEDLSQQLASTAKNLAVLRAQHRQLLTFVESKADVLGLTKTAEDAPPAEEKAPDRINGAEVIPSKPEK